MAHARKGSLAAELSCYEANKAQWVSSHPGEFVLIGDKSVVGFFPTFETAFEAGLTKFGVGVDFLIKQVVEHEPVFVIY